MYIYVTVLLCWVLPNFPIIDCIAEIYVQSYNGIMESNGDTIEKLGRKVISKWSSNCHVSRVERVHDLTICIHYGFNHHLLCYQSVFMSYHLLVINVVIVISVSLVIVMHEPITETLVVAFHTSTLLVLVNDNFILE